jgi:hypothetical protein
VTFYFEIYCMGPWCSTFVDDFECFVALQNDIR